MGQNQKLESLPITENNFTISVKGSPLSEIISWMFTKLKMDFTTIEKEDDNFYRINCIGGGRRLFHSKRYIFFIY